MSLKFALIVAVAALSSCQAAPSQSKLSAISVTNGGTAGHWGPFELCPDGTFAGGFSVKVDPFANLSDNTGVNGIRLHCTDGVRPNETLITSAFERFGEWGSRMNCLGSAYIQKFRLRVTPELDSVKDKMGVDNVEFTCTNGEILDGNGLTVGEWGPYSGTCTKGICGLQTLVQADSGNLVDDTGLNDVKFLCC